MPALITVEEQQRRMELYLQGLSDAKIAKELNNGISRGGIASWRWANKLPGNNPPPRSSPSIISSKNKRMEDVLTPGECARVRAFFGQLINCADRVPKGQKLDVGAFLTAWRDIYSRGGLE